MPAPIDPMTMIGRRFGQLVIVEPAGVDSSRARPYPLYRCRCDCGNEQVVAYTPLKNGRILACDACRFRRECTVCGKVFQSQQFKVTCSLECHRAYLRRLQLECYYRRAAADPELGRKTYQRKKEILAQDPERAAVVRERELLRSRRRYEAMTEDEREADRARRRRHYHENAAEIQRGRRERFMAKPPEERARVYARWLQNHRDWYARHREERREQQRAIYRADPEGWRAYKRERHRIRAQLQAQAELSALAEKLNSKITEE